MNSNRLEKWQETDFLPEYEDTGLRGLGRHKGLYFIHLGLQVLCLLAVFLSRVTYTSAKHTESASLFFIGADGWRAFFKSPLSLLLVIFYVWGIYRNLRPIIQDEQWKPRHFAMFWVTAVLGWLQFWVHLFILGFAGAFAATFDFLSTMEPAKMELNFFGDVYILCSIAAFVLSIVTPIVLSASNRRRQKYLDDDEEESYYSK